MILQILLEKLLVAAIAFSLFACNAPATTREVSNNEFAVIAYYTGVPQEVPDQTLDQLSHIIYSFLHLDGQKLSLDDARDSVAVSYLVSLKETHPDLKVLLSLGGWGGCETCSEIFSTTEGRTGFARSVKELLVRFNADGIDLD